MFEEEEESSNIKKKKSRREMRMKCYSDLLNHCSRDFGPAATSKGKFLSLLSRLVASPESRLILPLKQFPRVDIPSSGQ